VGDTDQFSPSCVAAFTAGFEDAKARGIRIKALMICNPHNPLGKSSEDMKVKKILTIY